MALETLSYQSRTPKPSEHCHVHLWAPGPRLWHVIASESETRRGEANESVGLMASSPFGLDIRCLRIRGPVELGVWWFNASRNGRLIVCESGVLSNCTAAEVMLCSYVCHSVQWSQFIQTGRMMAWGSGVVSNAMSDALYVRRSDVASFCSSAAKMTSCPGGLLLSRSCPRVVCLCCCELTACRFAGLLFCYHHGLKVCSVCRLVSVGPGTASPTTSSRPGRTGRFLRLKSPRQRRISDLATLPILGLTVVASTDPSILPPARLEHLRKPASRVRTRVVTTASEWPIRRAALRDFCPLRSGRPPRASSAECPTLLL
ncbi:unnamed protein product [Protopolystoma xenopodis]|uniref:Uncharacterized protein n=1 Tax=Protopolystoma xenopodis TaxID=117903 RepID=A0A3S5CGH6_9PLAT|nr:unnamed protein product [Protopolystoma xenopodis]